MKAMLEPTNVLKEAELIGDFTTRLALTEELKTFHLPISGTTTVKKITYLSA